MVVLTQSLEHQRARAPAARPGRRPPARWAHRSPACRGQQRRRPRRPPRRSRARRRARRRRPRTARPARGCGCPGTPVRLTQVARRSVHQPAADDAGDLLQGHRDHEAAARSVRAARSSSRSSKGCTVPAISWPVSCPLPAITTVSPARGHLHGPPDRRTPVADLEHLAGAVDLRSAGEHGGPDRGRVLGPRVVVGHHQHVGQPGPDLAHHRALAGVPVAAGTDDQHQPALGERPQRRRARPPWRRACGRSRRSPGSPGPRRPARAGREPHHRGRSRRRPAAGRGRPRPPARWRTARWRR